MAAQLPSPGLHSLAGRHDHTRSFTYTVGKYMRDSAVPTVALLWCTLDIQQGPNAVPDDSGNRAREARAPFVVELVHRQRALCAFGGGVVSNVVGNRQDARVAFTCSSRANQVWSHIRDTPINNCLHDRSTCDSQ